MVTATLAPTPIFKAFDNNGVPLTGGKLFTYSAGTTTKLASFTDSTGVTPNTNPVILNFRGEANVWVPPNVAYKFVLAPSTDSDPPVSPIWTVDQINNSQLLTLYGGVDTGIANAYVLTFVANFTAYTDGIIIYWIPANTNTGPSTINVNGLGVVNIVNADGSALFAGEITANQPAQILFKGGSFELVTPAASALNSFTAVWGGFSVPPAQTTIFYRKTGNIGALTIGGVSLTGTSNSTSFTLSGLPAVITPNIVQFAMPCMPLIDNGAIVNTPSIVKIASGVLTFFKDPSSTLWTAAGAKGFSQPISLVFPL